MELKQNITYGVSMSSISRRRKRRGGGGKKILAVLIVLLFVAVCVSFIKFGLIDYFSAEDRAASYIASGDERMANGDYEGALEDFSKAFEIEDTNADAAAAKGDAYTALKKFDEAEKTYLAALKIDDKCQRAYSGLIALSIERGIAGDAREWLAKAQEKGIRFDDNEWAILSAKVPKQDSLSVADNDLTLTDGSIKVTDSEVVYTDKSSSSKKVIYTGAPSSKFATDGVSVYIYDTGAQQIVLADAATGLFYKITDVYADADLSSEYYGMGRFCGTADNRYLYFSEHRGEDKYQTFVLDTRKNSFSLMDKVDIKSIIKKNEKLYFVSNKPGLFMCEYDGSNLTEICGEIKDQSVVNDMIIYTEPVDEYIVNVWKYDIKNDESISVAKGINVYLVNAFYEDFMSYYSIDEDTQDTELKTLEY